MKVLRAYISDFCNGQSSDFERMLVLEDGRAVILDPLGEDDVLGSELDGLLKLKGCAMLDDSLLELWDQGYPILSGEEVDALVKIGDHLDRIGASMTISVVPGPDYNACVPEGFVRFVDDLEAYVTVTYPEALRILGQVRSPRMILSSLAAWRRHADGAALWFEREASARALLAGRLLYFHPMGGISASFEGGGEPYLVPGTM